MCEGLQFCSPLGGPYTRMQATAFPPYGAQGSFSGAESGLHFEQGSNSTPMEGGKTSSGESSGRCSRNKESTSYPGRLSGGELDLEWLQRPLSGGRDFDELGRLLSEDSDRDWMTQESNAREVQPQQWGGGFTSDRGGLSMSMNAEGGGGCQCTAGCGPPRKGESAERCGAQSGEYGSAQPRVSRFRPPDALFLPAKRRGHNGQSLQPGASFAGSLDSAGTNPEGKQVPEDAAMAKMERVLEEGGAPWASMRLTDPPRTKLPRLGAKCAEELPPRPMQNTLQRTRSDPAQWLQNYMPGDEMVEDTLAPLPPPQMPPRPPTLQRHSSLPASQRGSSGARGRLQRQRSAPQGEVMALLAEQILLELQQSEDAQAQNERLSVDQVQQMWDQASAPANAENNYSWGSSSLAWGPQKQANDQQWHFGMQQQSAPLQRSSEDFLYPTTPLVPHSATGIPHAYPWAPLPQNGPPHFVPEAPKRPPILRAFERITVPELPPGGSPTSALPCAPNESVLVPVGPNLAQVMKIFQDSKQSEVTSSFLVDAPMQAAESANAPTWESLAFNDCLLDLDCPSPFADETGRRPH